MPPFLKRPVTAFETLQHVFTADRVFIAILVASYSVLFLVQLARPESFMYHTWHTNWPMENPGRLFEWINPEAPWRYRVLGRVLLWLVWRAAALFDPALSAEQVLIIGNWVIMAVVVGVFYTYLRHQLRLAAGWALAGGLAVITAFPVIWAFFPLTDSTEADMLAYLWVVLGIVLLSQKRYGLFTAVTVAGALTRETTLVLVLVLAVVDDLPVWKRALLGIPPIAVALLIRLAASPETGYLWLGWSVNSQFPLRALTYLFSSFGVWWLVGSTGWLSLRKSASRMAYGQALLVRSAPVAVGAILVTSAGLAILHETRIVFLAFPWLIGLSLMVIRERWRDLTNRALWARVAVLVTAALSAGIIFLLWFVLSDPAGGHLQALQGIPGISWLYRNIYVSYQQKKLMLPFQETYFLASLVITTLTAVVLGCNTTLANRLSGRLSMRHTRANT